VAAVFGLVSLAVLIGTGDGSAYNVAKVQPMKLAAMEGLYDGQKGAPLVAVGVLDPDKEILEEADEYTDPYLFDISFPKVLSFLATREFDGFVPGVNDIIKGGYEFTDLEGNTYIEPSFFVKKEMGSKAVSALASFQEAKKEGNQEVMVSARAVLDENFKYFGYHYIEEPEDLVPNVPLVFYAFHIMVTLGMYFILLFIVFIVLERKNLLDQKKFKWILWIGVLSVPLVYICSQSGWIVAEVGRQPWTIQNLLTVNASVSGVASGNVLTTLILFIVLFTTMLIAELSIMFKQIKKGA
jgi:cytochrome d ubiquinol oxidase subunit I